ncbi:CocE/NonD family hydrolase [Mycobacterium ulcerans]|uniref:Hydrolase n=1 Tax=Mycobacterium ulcerans subsp. shinshuense TaxID=1124626 RepID=A0A1B4Y5E6_MYCUL|nr:CocE/NonD family hydrolase [Mycobacterium ulcerans]BAV42305.1 hydrolase [Mycobacterium ulcerans subsp. shinshuense]
MSITSTHVGQPTLRALTKRVGGSAAGGALGGLLGLPRATTRYTVSRVGVPMRDGVHLVADHYCPTTSRPAGTVLVRGPYGRGFPFSLVFARLYAARGYHVVLQSVRGTFGSAGQFEPMVNEETDGADTVEWLRRQPWFTGRFATIGVSYLGFTQWALLQDPPPELAAAVITAGPHDLRSSVWGTGSFAINDFLGWSELVARQEDPVRIRTGIRQLTAPRRVARAAAELPMGESARTLLGTGAPWFESWLEHTDHSDPFWDRMRSPDALDRVQVPVLLVGGWQDVFVQQTLQQYRHLRDRGVDVALTIGPWTHSQLLSKGLAVSAQETLDWLDTHLGGTAELRRPDAVRVYVTGEGWRHLSDWPPKTTDHELYLHPTGRLSEIAPPDATTPATFRYDPTDPTPTIGGPLLSSKAGYRNDSRLASRNDVLTFTGSALTHDLWIHGHPVIELTHSSDNPNVDVFVRISEVDSNGRSRNVSDGYQRLGDAPETIRIELDPIAHRFKAGSRIRVLIAGSWFPRYARHLGTDEPTLTGRQVQPATHSVYFGQSRLLLGVDQSANDITDAGSDESPE